MGKKRRAAILPTNIILLQNVVKRDPMSYHDEFTQQYLHYQSLRDIYLTNPQGDSQEFSDLIGFVSAVCNCYPKETATFPDDLKNLLGNRDLHPDLREKIIQCLVMLRNKDVISPEYLIKTIFPLLTSKTATAQQGKNLRRQIYNTLISLLKAINQNVKNQKINKSTQALLFNLLEQRDNQGLWATKLTRELWRRGIWDDSRTVEIMTQASIHPDVKVSVAGAKFFLGADKEREENFESDSEDEVDMTSLRHKMQVNKKSGKRGKKLEAAVKAVKKKNNKTTQYYLNFSAIHLLRDPQGFAEQLFNGHLSGKNSNKFNLEQKILFMNLISRLIGSHKLTVLGIYSFFLKYLTPKQRDVTQIMAACAQASHDLVPPESINVVVRKIADEFVSDGVSAEVASAGLNTIREILSRAPLAIDATLLQDLTEYKGSKSKAVMMAARSLIGLYREVAPEMLHRKDRGKVATIEMSNDKEKVEFGVEKSTTSIPGIELLAKWREEQGLGDGDKEGDWEVEEKDSESESEDENDWVNIESDKEYNVSDSDDEQEPQLENSDDSELDLSDDERPTKKQKTAEQTMQEILSSKILTPADFAKLDELKLQAGVEKQMGIKTDDTVDFETLVGPVKYKQLREERIAHAKEGREGREKFGSRKGKRDTNHSTTNKEKARKKNFVMMIHKRSVQGKQKLSLRDRQKVLRAHITKQKRGGK